MPLGLGLLELFQINCKRHAGTSALLEDSIIIVVAGGSAAALSLIFWFGFGRCAFVCLDSFKSIIHHHHQ